MEATIEKNGKKEAIKRKKSIKKTHKLDELFGMLKGKIFYDDAIFNLGVKS